MSKFQTIFRDANYEIITSGSSAHRILYCIVTNLF